MRVLHVIPSISAAHGGPSFALPLMAKGLAGTGVTVEVATTDDDGGGRLDVRLGQPVEVDGIRHFYFRRQTQFYKFSWPLRSWLSKNICKYDLVHIHALFSWSSWAAAVYARRAHVPYIVRPLGVLNRWGMQNRRRLLKRLSFLLIERGILESAAAVHYTSEQEQIEAREAGVNGPGVVIPLGIETGHADGQPERFLGRFPEAAGRKIILFLSRIDPKKGLDILLKAFAIVHRQDPSTLLVIAGDGQADFVVELKALAQALGVESEVIWAGFLEGEDKLGALAAASIFVLPSYSENFGIAPVEALASGLPCIISDQVGITSDVLEYDAGGVSRCDADDLASEMAKLLSDPELRQCKAINARRLATDRFSVEVMARSLKGLYERVVVEGTSRICSSQGEVSGVPVGK